MDAALLEQLSSQLGGSGCVIKDGYVVKTWGDQALVKDWLSSAKPVLSTLLFFAIEEGRVQSVDQPIADFGWELREKDRAMTFRHLGAMTSGYARPEPPGEAWAYNDYAIQLYQKTLFDKVFQEDAKTVAEDPRRLGALQLQDGLRFSGKRRISASVRDFARIAWFWLHRGRWGTLQLLPRRYFDQYLRPQVPHTLPVSRDADTDDYLGIGTYGGGSEHFTQFGPGVYGFNWWFNGAGARHRENLTWPDAPPDTFMSIGARGNNAAIIPSLGLVLVTADADWNDLKAGDASSKMNQAIKLVAASAGWEAQDHASLTGALKTWQPVTLSFRGPESSETGTANPFTDLRLDVFFEHGERTIVVPGFFAADGNAAESDDGMRRLRIALGLAAVGATAIGTTRLMAADSKVVLFEDGFGHMRSGSIGSEVGAHSEYHYLPEVGAKGNWFISAFVSGAAPQRAWRVARHEGRPVLLQTYDKRRFATMVPRTQTAR